MILVFGLLGCINIFFSYSLLKIVRDRTHVLSTYGLLVMKVRVFNEEAAVLQSAGSTVLYIPRIEGVTFNGRLPNLCSHDSRILTVAELVVPTVCVHRVEPKAHVASGSNCVL